MLLSPLDVTRKGYLITLEGGEGVGKSTQSLLLARHLQNEAISVLATREPGGSVSAEALRCELLTGRIKDIAGPLGEAIVFSAARLDHIRHLIRPALQQGWWVICDRFADSTRIYQSASGLTHDILTILEEVVLEEVTPDITFVLDMPVELALKRAEERFQASEPNVTQSLLGQPPFLDRFESETVQFHQNIREGFRLLCHREPKRCLLLDAQKPPNALAAEIWQVIKERFLDERSPPSST